MSSEWTADKLDYIRSLVLKHDATSYEHNLQMQTMVNNISYLMGDGVDNQASTQQNIRRRRYAMSNVSTPISAQYDALGANDGFGSDPEGDFPYNSCTLDTCANAHASILRACTWHVRQHSCNTHTHKPNRNRQGGEHGHCSAAVS